MPVSFLSTGGLYGWIEPAQARSSGQFGLVFGRTTRLLHSFWRMGVPATVTFSAIGRSELCTLEVADLMETPGGLRVPTDQEGQRQEVAIHGYRPAHASLRVRAENRQVMNRSRSNPHGAPRQPHPINVLRNHHDGLRDRPRRGGRR